MNRPMVFNLPGNSTKESTFYREQTQPAMPGPEWPGPTNAPNRGRAPTAASDPPMDAGMPGRPDPRPFKLEGR